MKKIILLLMCAMCLFSEVWSQEGITLTQGNKAYYKLKVSGNRSYTDGPWFFGTTVCDKGMQEIRFLDKNSNRLKTIDTNGKTGNFEYNTGDHEFTKNQFPIKVHIDNDFVDRLLCKGWAIYDFPDSWWTDEFKNRGMEVIKVEYDGACYSRRYTGFWQPDDRYYGDIFYYHAAYVYMRNLRVNSEPVVEIQTPNEPLYLASEEYVTVSVPDNLLSNYSYYWKFKVGNEQNYRGISNQNVFLENGNKVLRIKGKDFLRTSDYGKRIRLVLDADCKESNAISFTYYPSAPRVINVEKFDPVCFEGDGEVKISFDRNLNSSLQEKLTINLKDDLGVKYTSGILTTFVTEGTNSHHYTFEGVKAGEYQIEFAGGNMTINGEILSTIVRDPVNFVIIEDPAQVLFDITVKDSSCNDGDTEISNNNDGVITITAEGGRPGVFQYAITPTDNNTILVWQDFDSIDQHAEHDLRPSQYEIQVRKKIESDYCTGHFKSDVSKTVVTETISEPDNTLNVTQVFYKEPTANGFSDGEIRYLITGGTPYEDGAYRYEFKNTSDIIQNTVTTEVLDNNEGYVLTLHSVESDIYTLWVSDKNYDEAIYKKGCFENNISFNLQEPDPIEVVFEVLNLVSCNIYNEFNDGRDFEVPYNVADQFQDGQIVAHVTGGAVYDINDQSLPDNNIPLNDRGERLPYYYNWKKRNDNVWTEIEVNDSIINNQSYGDYALNITDKNGIVLGNYRAVTNSDGTLEYVLSATVDSTFYLAQPTQLSISFEKTEINCFDGADATASALVTGGVPPYDYYWSNGATSQIADNLIAGRHLIYVTDIKGCVIEGSVVIEQPNGLVINPINEIAPTCYTGADGFIEITATGGEPPYTYLWNTGATTTSINNLSAGSYSLEIVDQNRCKAYYEIVLENPALVTVDLPEKYTLCQGQNLALDVTINDPEAVYAWSSDRGFLSTDSQVLLNESGVYTAQVTNGLGCSNQDTIVVNFLDKGIDAHYLIATQAYVGQEVTLINISEPIGDMVEWSIPERTRVLNETDEELTLIFEEEGVFDINLRSHVEDCYKDFNKSIIVQPAIIANNSSETDRFLKEFILYPNPSTGTFQTKITLENASDISVKIIHLTSGAILDEKQGTNNVEFLFDNSVSLSSGLYLVILETSRGTSRRKLIIE
ncbi:T9SS type A sorting domain-containing protein [uncultured Aquimarina sp.]|uniref:T9SS type A sorting domain-containing protein n=1 Tax=uncultured Aquimarina sp. TaxID=575652 RepID=UPI002610B2BB|nr:T9SS type A sorting domain-containing protein [uncultured Aquimarina sp.]